MGTRKHAVADFLSIYDSKWDAEQAAAELRGDGHRVRIVQRNISAFGIKKPVTVMAVWTRSTS